MMNLPELARLGITVVIVAVTFALLLTLARRWPRYHRLSTPAQAAVVAAVLAVVAVVAVVLVGIVAGA